MKKRALPALLLTLVMLCSFAACSAKGQSAAYDAAAPQAPAAYMDAEMKAEEMGVTNTEMAYSAVSGGANAQSAPAEADKVQPDSVRKIVYNADMSVTADDPAAALQALIDQNAALGGYLASSYTRTDELGAYHCSAELKVPADRLEALVAAAEATGRVDSYQLYSDDITRDYYDIQARLNSAKAEEAQLLEILEKCETVEDIIVVRQSLAAVRSDIESYQGQINLWDNLVSFATLHISISRTPRASVEKENELIALWKASDVWNRMGRAFQNSVRFVINALGAIGIFLAYAIIPAAVVATLIVLIVKLCKASRAKRAIRKEKRLAKKAERRAAREENHTIQNE